MDEEKEIVMKNCDVFENNYAKIKQKNVTQKGEIVNNENRKLNI